MRYKLYMVVYLSSFHFVPAHLYLVFVFVLFPPFSPLFIYIYIYLILFCPSWLISSVFLPVLFISFLSFSFCSFVLSSSSSSFFGLD